MIDKATALKALDQAAVEVIQRDFQLMTTNELGEGLPTAADQFTRAMTRLAADYVSARDIIEQLFKD